MPDVAEPLALAESIPYDRLAGFSSLFARYAARDAEALRFFAHDWADEAAWTAAADTTVARPLDRDALADVLAEQNAAWGQKNAAVDRLRDPEAVAVVTGQQLGLFGGPLYTVYKAATAVRFARTLARKTGRPVVPVFWLAGEDHDYEEVRSTLVLRDNDPVRLALPDADARTPVGRRTLPEAVADLLDDAEAALRPTEFTADLLAALRDAYQPGRSMRDAFARWMVHLFGETDLVLVSSDDARLKRLATPVFAQEIDDPQRTLDALTDASDRLAEAGFHRQITPMPGQLFLMEPEGRFTLDPEPSNANGGGFVLRGLDRRYSRDELRALLDAEPERFSPNVVLRPLVEAALFPTAAYVAGPGETAYYAQLGGVYEAFGTPMPLILPRLSLTLVEGKVRKVLDRYDLALPDLEGDLDRLHRRLALDASEHDVEVAFADAARALHEAMNTLKPVAASVDQTLGKSAEATRAALAKELESLKTRVVRAEKRQHDQIRDQLAKAQANAFPTGRPQERVLSPLYVLNKYPDLVERLLALPRFDPAEHQLAEV